MLKNLTIYKRKEVKTATQPTHDLVAIDEKYTPESKVIVGALWTKITEEGNKFLSGTLSKERMTTDGKSYEGYVIITDREYREYQELKNNKPDTGEVSNVDDIPF